MKGISSIVITPYQILEKSSDHVLMISNRGEYRRLGDITLLMRDFNSGDYLFQGRMVGKGFVQYNYVKMTPSQIKTYFSKEEPRDRFSKFTGTSFFPKSQNL